ncbi:YraN family protein [bacterium]|nr:YraN family protein [bacterium]
MPLADWIAWLRSHWLSHYRLPLGRRSENLAAEHLARQGMKIVERSYRCSLGEIDLVAVDKQTLVFVEVRSRVGSAKGEPWETIRSTKRRKLSSLALLYLKSHRDRASMPARFDVVSVVWNDPDQNDFQIEHFPNAFPLEGPWLA